MCGCVRACGWVGTCVCLCVGVPQLTTSRYVVPSTCQAWSLQTKIRTIGALQLKGVHRSCVPYSSFTNSRKCHGESRVCENMFDPSPIPSVARVFTFQTSPGVTSSHVQQETPRVRLIPTSGTLIFQRSIVLVSGLGLAMALCQGTGRRRLEVARYTRPPVVLTHTNPCPRPREKPMRAATIRRQTHLRQHWHCIVQPVQLWRLTFAH